MKKTLVTIAVFTVFLMVVQPVPAHVFKLSSNKTTYNPGDKIIIKIEVKNTMNIEKNMDIYITIKEENNKYPPLSWYYPVTLSSGETRNITVYSTNVSSYIVNGDYIVYAQLLEDGFTLYEEETRFSITGLPEAMKVDILLSDDSRFSVLKDVFLLNQRIYIGYNSSAENTSVNCEIIYPDNASKNITLPYDFIVDQTGLYSLNINAHNEGYKSVNKNLQFAVIEKNPFYEKEKKSPQINKRVEVIIYTIILLLIIAIIIFFVFRKKKML